MRPRGMTLVEVLVALGVAVVVGGTLSLLVGRSDQAGRASEAGEAATYLLQAMVQATRQAPPPWLPGEEGRTVTLSEDQIQVLLAGAPNQAYADPRLYEVRVTRGQEERGLTPFRAEVCVRVGGNPYCLQQTFHLGSSQGHYLPPREGDALAEPQPGQGVLLLDIQGPEGGLADVSVSGQTLTRYGLYVLTLAPGSHTIEGRPAADPTRGYSYEANPTSQRVDLVAGGGRRATVTYTCTTGALNLRVIPPPLRNLPDRTIVLNPGNRDVTRGGLVGYLSRGNYTLEAQRLSHGGYTYDPQYHPGRTIGVTPCETAQATVSYVPITGKLTLVARGEGLTVPVEVGLRGPAWSGEQTLTLTPSTPRTLEDLPPGEYEYAPKEVVQEGVRYRGDAGRARVDPGQETSVTIRYKPVSGRITYALSGPQGAPAPRVTLQGPRGYTRTFTAYSTYTLDDLAPGSYTFTGGTVQDSLYTYSPTPSTLSLELGAGDRLSATQTYRPTTGALRVTVTGLPSGVTPNVSVGGTPMGGTDQTFPYLSPGTLRVTAGEVTVTQGGATYVYAPERADYDVEIRPGETANLAIPYRRLEGTIRVEFTGLPQGLPEGTLLGVLSGERIRDQEIRSPRVALGGMPTGRYALSARSFTHGGVTYKPSPEVQEGLLPHGGDLAFRVAYQPITGILQVEITGLPQGTPANVTVTSPNGYSNRLTASATLTDLNPGTYTVIPHSVQAQEDTPYGILTYTYAGSASPQTLEVRAGEVSRTTVTYRRQSGDLALSVSGLPQGATPRVKVSGPGGFTWEGNRGNGTYSFPGVPAGNYAASGEDLTTSLYTYKATPATGTLSAGGSFTLALDYRPANGAVSYLVTAPQGMPAPTLVLYRYENGTNHEVARQTAFSGAFPQLAPGTYKLVPQIVVDSSGFSYTAPAASLEVRAGETTNVTVVYAKQSAFVTLSVTGLPQGVSPRVDLRGPRNYTFLSPGTYEVVTGNYRVEAREVTAGGYTYRPTAVTPREFSLAPGDQAGVAVTYTEDSANLQVSLSGLPQGAGVTLGLTGPVTRTATGNGTLLFSRLPLGSYTLYAPEALWDGIRYIPTPASQGLTLDTPGRTFAAQVAYQAVSGVLEVEVAGPAGMPSPTLRLEREGSSVASWTGTGLRRFEDLPPGRYTVVPEEVVSGNGVRYRGDPVSLYLFAGEKRKVQVVYRRLEGTIRVEFTGLPQGASSSANLRGPGVDLFLTHTVTLTNMPAGSYTLTAGSVAYEGITYHPDPPTQSGTLSPGGTLGFRVNYTPATGILRVQISGLPEGWAKVEVTGPNGYYAFLGSSTTLTNLPPGGYTVTARCVKDWYPQYWEPSPRNQGAWVSPGGTTTAFVAYGWRWNLFGWFFCN